jgi:hypothetical protein
VGSLDQIVEVFDLAQLTSFGNPVRRFQILNRLGVGRVLVHIDDARFDRVRRASRCLEQGSGGIAAGAEPELEGIARPIHRAIIDTPTGLSP